MKLLNLFQRPNVEEGDFQMVATSLDYDVHKGKHVIGRIKRGNLTKGQALVLIDKDGNKIPGKAESIRLSHGLKKVDVEEAFAGDIVDLTGFSNVTPLVTPLLTAKIQRHFPRIEVEEPTIRITACLQIHHQWQAEKVNITKLTTNS
jgi:GTP-binding protein